MTSAVLPALRAASVAKDARVRAVALAHYDALWRFLRRMGVPESLAEDAAQQVLLVFARRADGVEPGAERPFLFATAVRVASDVRKKGHLTREVPGGEEMLLHPDPRPSAHEHLESAELRKRLDDILDELPAEQRSVFVLAELEELTMGEISRLLSVPQGTVASRLRRAREVVMARIAEAAETGDGTRQGEGETP